MKAGQYHLEKTPDFDFDIIAPKERIVFFDIETTGLSRERSRIYLLGVVVYEDGAWILRQYFSEGQHDEADILRAFMSELSSAGRGGRAVLISFNGDSFDIPFVKSRMAACGIWKGPLESAVSLDLYKSIRPYRKLLGIGSLGLKAVERFCGIEREDRYSGGELIYVYEEYLRLSGIPEGMLDDNDLNRKLREHLLETLLKHNAEDIADMPFIMGILGYGMLFEGQFDITGSNIVSCGLPKEEPDPGVFGRAEEADTAPGRADCERELYWDIRARLRVPLPREILAERGDASISISGRDDPYLLNIAVRLFSGELRYFFRDYKDYYYLPAEDFAVHKSVGGYVSRSARRQATAATCYQKRKGIFAEDPGGVLGQAFFKGDRRGRAYGELTKVLKENNHVIDTNITKSYILALVKELLK